MNPETLRHSTAGGRELWGSQPAPLLVLAGRLGLENHNKQKPTKNHLHKFLYKAAYHAILSFRFPENTCMNWSIRRSAR